MSYENFIFHSPCAQTCPQCDGSKEVPEGDGLGECPSCKGKGTVELHDWITAGEAKDGTQFVRCRRCRKEVES